MENVEQFVSSLPYVYSVAVPALAPGEVFNGFFSIQADSHFLARERVVKVRATVGENEPAQSIPDATVVISDTASGRAFMREPVKISNIFGRGFFPYKIPLGGKIFYKSQTIQVQVVNGAAITQGMVLEWNGEKIFTTS